MANEIDLLQHLKSKAGNAVYHLLKCPECHSIAKSIMKDSQFSWCSRLKCSNCDISWWVCHRCLVQRAHFMNRTAITRHHHSFHQQDSLLMLSPPVSPSPASKKKVRKHGAESSSDDEEIYEPIKVEGVHDSSTGIKSELRKIPDGLFKREASTCYFQQSTTKERTDMGARQIVAEAVFNNVSFGKYLHEKDVHMIMNMSTFIDTLTRTQREHLATVLDDAVNLTK